MSEKKKRTRYYIDKNFQNQFIGKFSSIILIIAAIIILSLWFINKNAYNLLPGNTAVLSAIDAGKSRSLQLEKTPDGTYKESDSADASLFLEMKKTPKIYDAFEIYWLPFLLISGVYLVVIIIFSLFFSHKMAGPVHRIKLTLEEYNSGKKVHRIRLRKGDYFDELADLINKALKLEDKKNDK